MNCGKGAFIEAVQKSPPSFDEILKLPRIQSTETLIAEVKISQRPLFEIAARSNCRRIVENYVPRSFSRK